METTLKLKVAACCKSRKGSQYDEQGLWNSAGTIFIVADGVSAHPRPAEASLIASHVAFNFLAENDEYLQDGTFPEERVPEFITNAFSIANKTLFTLSEHYGRFGEQSELTKKRAGTTLDVCYFLNGNLYVGHVGDGSVYLLRANALRNITRIYPADRDEGAEKYRALQSGILDDFVGGKEEVEPHIQNLPLQEGDVVLMATDGLTKLLYDDEIKDVLQQSEFDRCATDIVRAARMPNKVANYVLRQEGGLFYRIVQQMRDSDAITVVAMKAEEKNEP